MYVINKLIADRRFVVFNAEKVNANARIILLNDGIVGYVGITLIQI